MRCQENANFLHTQKSLDSQLTLFANTLTTLIEVLQILIHETFQ
jgi:hypothetical protein